VKVIVSPSHNYQTWEMKIDAEPFDDPRVRQAIMLIADRQQIVDQAFGGDRFSTIANDLPSKQDPMYATSIPQRTQDIEKAKALLKEAGKENLTVELVVSPVQPGLIETATILAQEAKAAGVTININNVADSATYFSDYWFQAPFKFTYFPTYDIWSHITASLTVGGTSNVSSWADPEWQRLYEQARGTADAAKRLALMAQVQQIQWERGSQAIFAYFKTVDAYSTKFAGFFPSAGGRGLNGLHFDSIGLA
jgi:peptide/nickel transport system substrate-binding protein